MKVRQPEVNAGAMILLYGETGVGKTVSTLLTAPKPIYYVEVDPKPVERTALGVVDFSGITIAHPENFLDLFEYINGPGQEEIPKSYKSLIIDPFSFLINVILLGDLEDETAKAEVFGKSRPLLNLGRTDQAGYGSLASLAKRLCKGLGNIAIQGVAVICISLLDDSPKWNRDLVAAPAFAGREFNRDYPAYFDFIGLVERRMQDDQLTFPPLVTFDSPDTSFIHKWSGARKSSTRTIKGPLNIQQILAMR